MRWIQVGMAGGLLAMAVSTSGPTGTVAAQRGACLHATDETPDQAARRKQALGLTRQINTLQARGFGASKASLPLDRLTLTETPPEGFAVQLSTDGATYSFSVVDQTDPCRFGYFSNHEGVIYRGQALQ
jgi:hypothetical protein